MTAEEAAMLPQRAQAALAITLIALVGTCLGVFLPATASMPQPWGTLSAILGWTYFATWSWSFWPQILVNYQRKSVVGLSFDFVLLNLLGFLSYGAYCLALYLNEDVRREYRVRHFGQDNGVRLNDLIFALHASGATLIVVIQCFIYERGGQLLSRTCLAMAGGILAVCGALWAAARSPALHHFQDLDLIYVVGYIKVGITLAKYLPQALMNFRRKSTDGFAIVPVLCDITGSVLALGQQVLDAVAMDDPAILFGNSVKLAISLVSIAYDVILITQHYIMYPDARPFGGGDPGLPILAADSESHYGDSRRVSGDGDQGAKWIKGHSGDQERRPLVGSRGVHGH
eukprot:CAMPEP_0206135104 /NCGR_PEP_ID=MMETSP1473-20131121/468_1 /ASSEMBLY_ACC=CAM_ASM_001109 /TAXON_ID=1461547 /ORGANISM="Stichococcus sp, Strain RCC1054" /LENGTH=342 /DNA_ID=CAMNT_0053526841 /DNA_START=340 /DNA_END=1368 /DNA_ORIENTATION=+